MIAKAIDTPYPLWSEIAVYLSDDYADVSADTIDEKALYWGVFDGHEMAGAFYVRPWNPHCFEIHGGVAKEYWGRGYEVCWTLGNTLFDLTLCNKIVCPIPEYNRLMAKCLEKCGLKLEGRITKAWCKYMRFWDMLMYGIKKSERGLLCPQ